MFLKTHVLLAVSVSLGAIFWVASIPLAQAAAVTPAEMIQAHLPHSMSMASAPKADVLSAVCKAIAKNPKDAPDIVRTAAGARKEIAPDILKMAVHCLHEDKGDVNCEIARGTLREVIAADPEEAAGLTQLFISLIPSCIESPEEGPGGVNNAPSLSIAPGSLGGGAGGVGDVCSVCHNNQSIQVPCGNLNAYLASHPGDTAGACEATPNTNR